MQSYKEELIWSKNKDKFVKVMSLPSFAKSNSIILLDIESLHSYEMTFDIADLDEGIT
jgi:hypothetical protein